MGTPGYIVYRYRNIYFAYYHHWDGGPEFLGVSVITLMRQPDAIANTKKRLEKRLNEVKVKLPPEGSSVEPEQGDEIISWTRPTTTAGVVTCIYEVDLDHNIFHMNEIPFFRLDCLPDEDSFVKYTTKDRYFHACPPDCPPCHRYKRPEPPDVPDSDLTTYLSLVCTNSHAILSDLLVVSDILTPDEHLRIVLLEIIVGRCMTPTMRFIAPAFYKIELATTRSLNHLTDKEWSFVFSMANFAFIPQIFDTRDKFNNSSRRNRAEFVWVREDTVLCIATHLEDERCLKATISHLINVILEQKHAPGDYFGVAFSVHECAIVKVIKDEHATTFSHTDTLQFLPSNHRDYNSPSTLGIVALARLAHRIDPELYTRTLRSCNPQWLTMCKGDADGAAKGSPVVEDTNSKDTVSRISVPVLPTELLCNIARRLDVDDLLIFGLVSGVWRGVASAILRHPHVGGYRLVALPEANPYCPRGHTKSLTAALFYAVKADTPALVAFGCRGERTTLDIRIADGRIFDSLSTLSITFSAGKCICGRAIRIM